MTGLLKQKSSEFRFFFFALFSEHKLGCRIVYRVVAVFFSPCKIIYLKVQAGSRKHKQLFSPENVHAIFSIQTVKICARLLCAAIAKTSPVGGVGRGGGV